MPHRKIVDLKVKQPDFEKIFGILLAWHNDNYPEHIAPTRTYALGNALAEMARRGLIDFSVMPTAAPQTKLPPEDPLRCPTLP
jgi:hypothetical protein